MIDLDKYVDKIITIFQDEQFGFVVKPDEIQSKSLRNHLKLLLSHNVLHYLARNFLAEISQYSRCPYCGCTKFEVHVIDEDQYLDDMVKIKQKEGSTTKRADAKCDCCGKEFDVMLDWGKSEYVYRKKEEEEGVSGI